MFNKIILLAIVSLVFAGAGCSRGNYQDSGKRGEGDNIPLKVSDDNSGGVIELSSPQKDQLLASPFLVAGKGDLPGKRAYVRVKNKEGQSVIEAWTAAKGPENNFSVFVSFNFRGTTEGTVEVYGKDDDGNEIGLQSVPVKFDVATSEDIEPAE